jgi:hypothetical protein
VCIDPEWVLKELADRRIGSSFYSKEFAAVS